MYEIFINYRREQTTASASHLYDNLRLRFGKDAVFLDTRRTVPWGTYWDEKLKDALENCETLVALIGPRWSTWERSPGKPGLHEPDDWVRSEIATAIRKSKTVYPVLIEGGAAPLENELPADLRELRFHRIEAYPISETHWDEERDHLVSELIKNPTLKKLYSLNTSERGIRLLEQLIRENRKVADTVSKSRSMIETTDRGVDEIGLLKDIHDSLHEIEANALEPIRGELRQLRERESSSNIGEPVTSDAFGEASRKFDRHEGKITKSRKQLASTVSKLSGLLDVELPERLDAVKLAFANVANPSTIADFDHIVSELEGLAGAIPSRLNDEIERAMRELELHQLRDLMTAVIDQLGPAAVTDPELKALVLSVPALEELRKSLGLRVRDHGLLQGIDNKLRSLFEGQYRDKNAWKEANRAILTANWNSIQRLRKLFEGERSPVEGESSPVKRECSPVVEENQQYLKSIEDDIKTVIARGDETSAILARLQKYAKEIGRVFRDVDSNLKEFCGDLRKTTLPLKTILQQTEPEPQDA